MRDCVVKCNNGDNRLRKGQRDPQKEAEIGAAVNMGGFQKFVGNAVLEKGTGNNHVIY